MGEFDGVIGAGSPKGELGIEFVPPGGDGIAQGFEKFAQYGFAAAAGENGYFAVQGHGCIYQFGSFFALAVQGASKGFGQCGAHEGGADIGAVVDVLVQGEAAFSSSFAPDKGDGIDIEQQGGGAFFRGGDGVEDVYDARAEGGGLAAVRVFVEEVSQIRGGLICRRQGQQHA